MPTSRLVVALDVPDPSRAASLVERLSPLGVLFKVGYEAFYAYGAEVKNALRSFDAAYALDLKLHDIPRTVDAAVRAITEPGVRLLTVHALGGAAMMEAAVRAAQERAAELAIPAPEVYAVTVLTSLAAEDLGELGLLGGPGENATRLAALARDARCAGVVCSVREVADIKAFFGSEFGTFCPGIRPLGSAHGDQKRAATPREAREAGADYVVVGRPIVDDADPVGAARAILDELAG
jgi:orotidine-5'-phosphate decarboxylase